MDEMHRKYHPVSQIFPLLQGDEFDSLCADIQENGLIEPIWIHPDGSIIDGRNRHRACIETMTTPRFRTWDGNGSLVSFVVSMNLHRRHLSSSQKAMIALDVLPLLEDEARTRQVTSTGGASPQLVEIMPQAVGTAREQAARIFDTNARYVQDAKRIRSEAPELAEQILSGEITIPEAKREIKKNQQQTQREIEAQTAATISKNTKQYHIIHGDFATVDIEPHTIDCIITDPPYAKEFLPLYESLAKCSHNWLKSGGLLIVMTGQSYIPEILNLMTPHITYHWMCAYLTPGGQSPQIWQRKVNAFWKPLLIFSNGEYHGSWIGDVIKSDVNDNDKRFHNWGQSESGTARIIEKFSKPNDLILDPMMGAGTTGIVSLSLKRRFIGIDIDIHSVNAALARIGELKHGTS